MDPDDALGPSGIRTSIYNAVTLDNVEILVKFMQDFKAQEQK